MSSGDQRPAAGVLDGSPLARGTARFDSSSLARGTARFDSSSLARGTARFDAWRALGAVLALATGCDPVSEGEQLPLNNLRLPSMSCAAPLAQAGGCGRRADCGEGQHCRLEPRATPADRAPAPLECGAPIGTRAARARCDEGRECETGLCALTGVCLSPCRDSEDCPAGQACQAVEARGGEDALFPVQACARVAAFPADVLLARQSARLRSGTLNSVTVFAAQPTLNVFLKGDCARRIQVQRIVESASQHVLFNVAADLGPELWINPSVNEGALVPLLLPNNPRLNIRGDYELGVVVDADAVVDVISASRGGRGRVLDLNVFYVGGGSTFAPAGLRPGSAELADVLARLGERYAAIDIELGTVREYDVVGALRTQLAELSLGIIESGGRPEQALLGLDQLFSLSAGVEDGGVNLFVLRLLGPLLGISGGTPGAVAVHGSPLSGVAIALDAVGLERADQVLFHELGHQLGLFHTTERAGERSDPLSDTPSCPLANDTNGDGELRSDECRDRDADNLMFWEGGGQLLSPQQIQVLQRSLVLR